MTTHCELVNTEILLSASTASFAGLRIQAVVQQEPRRSARIDTHNGADRHRELKSAVGKTLRARLRPQRGRLEEWARPSLTFSATAEISSCSGGLANMPDLTYVRRGRRVPSRWCDCVERSKRRPSREKHESKLGSCCGGCRKTIFRRFPASRPMPTIGPNCHELRVDDRGLTWRILDYIDLDARVARHLDGFLTSARNACDVTRLIRETRYEGRKEAKTRSCGMAS